MIWKSSINWKVYKDNLRSNSIMNNTNTHRIIGDKNYNNCLDITATFPRTSLLDNITLREPIDENLLDKCIHSDLLVTHYTDTKWFKNEKTQLQKFKKSIYGDEARVKYVFKDDYSFGRVNVVGSIGLHSILRNTRGTFVKDKMVDVDMQNAHLSQVLQVLQHNKYDRAYSHIEDYVVNRDCWFAIIVEAFGLSDLYVTS